MTDVNTGIALKTLRTAFNLSQQEFAERLQIDQSYLSLLESGQRPPSKRIRGLIATELAIPAELVELVLDPVAAAPHLHDEAAAQFGRLLLEAMASIPRAKIGEVA